MNYCVSTSALTPPLPHKSHEHLLPVLTTHTTTRSLSTAAHGIYGLIASTSRQAGPLVPGLGIGRPTAAAAAGSSISALHGRAQRPPHSSSLCVLNKPLRGGAGHLPLRRLRSTPRVRSGVGTRCIAGSLLRSSSWLPLPCPDRRRTGCRRVWIRWYFASLHDPCLNPFAGESARKAVEVEESTTAPKGAWVLQ